MTPARLLVPLSLALLAACAQKPANVASLDDADDCPLTLSTGQTLILSLPSNPTTGYRWQVRDAAPGVLRSLGPEVYNADQSKELVVGNGGQSVWRFKADSAGTGNLSLTYQQAWDADSAPQERFECVIRVH
ncbi:protease inhibitor I42 family protein [Pseudomonas sp. 21LCFQ02]|uniref:protease inhibitor I42 family protein n=1 Tax=Pseudomonas sp. 21LCFQ02 TaxID=2957505 RepID=UPI00209A8B4C|nr:protease inhibitor I42 family protein [Pseudomonas sp. 21LCFQ02]MCO8170676.1 protease inhibitor I42 family protein [Pseudomonas sp. 21LCFQ02]